MAKRCPPGVICIENMTIFMIVISLLVVLYLVKSCSHRNDCEDHPNTLIFPSVLDV